MSLFDSIINTDEETFGLSGDEARRLLKALLNLINENGFNGFLDRFRNAGLGDAVDSWVSTGDTTPLSNEQLESALDESTIQAVADEAGIDRERAVSAMSGMIPRIVDVLTPDGEVPDDEGLRSRIDDFLKESSETVGDATPGATALPVGEVLDRVDAAAGASYAADEAAGDVAGAADTNVSDTVSDVFEGEGDNNSMLKWLIPLILLGLLVLLGFWFCSKSPPPTPTNTNMNTNAAR